MGVVLRGAVIGALASAGWVVACGSTTAAGPGQECFLATDCKAGLVCVQQKCTDDLSKVAGKLPPEASIEEDAEAGDEASHEGGRPPRDGSAPKDAGPPKDTGTTPTDAAKTG